MGKVKLTERDRTLLAECGQYTILDTGGSYYRMGGHGEIRLRYNFGSLPKLAKDGLLKRAGGDRYVITDLGRSALAEADRSQRDG